MIKIAITGGLNTGKSLLALELGQILGCGHRLTDELLVEHPDADWNFVTQRVVEWLETPGPWVLCGVRIPHALLQFNLAQPEAPLPVDMVVILTRALSPLTPKQMAASKSILTVWDKCEKLLRPRCCYREYDPRLARELAAELSPRATAR